MNRSAGLRLAASGFKPSFGPRGELRQKVGDGGRVHLDRSLPFLVLHRSTEPETSIARRVAVNSPAYLVWPQGDDDAAQAALDAILPVLGDKLGSLLLIEVRDGEWSPQEEDSPELPPFVVTIGSSDGSRTRAARDALADSVRKIEIDLRSPEIRLVEEESATGDDRLSLTIPPIHRAPDGRLYPQLTHELAVALIDSLLRAAAAFMAETESGAPAHFRSLGRSAVLAAALHADKKLDAIARSYDFLLSLSPINTLEAMNRFLDEGGDRPPEFRYRPLTVDPDTAKRELYDIDLSILEDPLLESLLCEKRREIDYQLTLTTSRWTGHTLSATPRVR